MVLHALFLKASFDFLLQASMGIGSTMVDAYGHAPAPWALARTVADFL